MRKIIVAATATLAIAVGGLALPGGAAADDYVCPDHHLPYFVFFDESGKAAEKDNNNNGVVCRKYDPTNPEDPVHGGPDDKVDPADLIDDIA